LQESRTVCGPHADFSLRIHAFFADGGPELKGLTFVVPMAISTPPGTSGLLAFDLKIA
jgi:hypothetical protein